MGLVVTTELNYHYYYYYMTGFGCVVFTAWIYPIKSINGALQSGSVSSQPSVDIMLSFRFGSVSFLPRRTTQLWIVAIIGEWGYHNTWIHRSEGWSDDTTVPHIHDVTTRVRCHLPRKISRACGFPSPCVNRKHVCSGGESFLNGWLP